MIERACMLSEGRVLSEAEVLAALGGGHYRAPAPVATAAATAQQPPEAVPELDRRTIE